MDIILQEDYPQLGYVGDKVRVRDGFARNYLLPRGIAVAAGSRQGNVLKHQMTAISAKRARLKKSAEELSQRLAQAPLEFKLKAGEHGKLFGSVTSKDIETELKKQGFQIERKQIRFGEAIKSAGQFKIEVKLHSEVSVPMTVTVISEAPPPAPKDKEEKPRKGGRRARGKTAEEEGGESPDASDQAPAGETDAAEEQAE